MKKTLLLKTTEVPVTFIMNGEACKNCAMRGMTFVLENGTYHHELSVNSKFGEYYFDFDDTNMMTLTEIVLKGLKQELQIIDIEGTVTIGNLSLQVSYMPS